MSTFSLVLALHGPARDPRRRTGAGCCPVQRHSVRSQCQDGGNVQPCRDDGISKADAIIILDDRGTSLWRRLSNSATKAMKAE